jgi:Uma2 family endonuclease
MKLDEDNRSIPLSELLRADELGVRLEIVGGLPLWESSPVYRHQKEIDRIRASIQPIPGTEEECACIHAADVYIAFPEGSLKRPDISIFCREPDEQEEAIRLVPEAVIEVISKGFEAKDLEIGPRFYLSQGVRDVVVLDPYTLVVLHVRPDGADRLVSPVEIELACGCRCTV